MIWTYFIEEIKSNYETELQECIKNGFDPFYHAANWNHFKDRIVKSFTDFPGTPERKHKFQTEIDDMIASMKPEVEQWLEYYKKHNGNGAYDGWLERFWIEEKLDEETEEYYYMMRMYEKFIKEGVIENYYYTETSDRMRQQFLNKWHQRYNYPYRKDEDEYLYVGQKGVPGNFYFGYGDFYEPVDNPQKSAWWRLVSQVLQENSKVILK